MLTELQRLRNAKASIKTAIQNKNVSVPDSARLSDLSGYISQIETGGTYYTPGLVERTLTSYTFPSSLTDTTGYSLYMFESLQSVNMNNCRFVETNMFRACPNLYDVNFSHITSIGANAFYNCLSLKYLDLPATLTSIGRSAFCYCGYNTTVICRAVTPPSITNDTFYGTNIAAIYVPAESVNAYKTATNWSTYADKITAISQ